MPHFIPRLQFSRARWAMLIVPIGLACLFFLPYLAAADQLQLSEQTTVTSGQGAGSQTRPSPAPTQPNKQGDTKTNENTGGTKSNENTSGTKSNENAGGTKSNENTSGTKSNTNKSGPNTIEVVKRPPKTSQSESVPKQVISTTPIPPIDVHIAWLDGKVKQTAVMVLTRLDGSDIVVWIAKLSDLGNLDRIPRFKRLIPPDLFPEFRQAVTTAKTSTNVRVHPPVWTTDSYSLNDIDKEFRDYVNNADTKSGDRKFWTVTPAGKTFDIVVLGELVLVTPTSTSSPHNDVEQAIIELLRKIIVKERDSVTLTADCGNDILTPVRGKNFKATDRKNLQDALTRKMEEERGRPANEFLVKNNSLIDQYLTLDLKTSTSASNFKVTAVVDENESVPKGILTVPPCQAASISIKPNSWYEFPNTVKFVFNKDEGRLAATIPDPHFNLSRIFIGIVALLSVVLLIFLLRSKKTWVYALWKGREVQDRSVGELLHKDQRKRRSGNETLGILPSDNALREPASESRRLRHELELREQELNAAQAENKRWQELRKVLGDSPEAIVNDWHNLNHQQQFVTGKLFNLEALLNGGDGPSDNVDDALHVLYEEVLRLKEYQNATARIVQLVDGRSAIKGSTERVVQRVQQLSNFSNMLLLKYAEVLQMDHETPQFSEQSLAEIEQWFERSAKAREKLASLETDERIHLARLSSARIQKAGRLLEKLEKTNPEYASLFTGTGLDLTTTARQLHEASASLNAALTRASARQLRSENGGAFGQLEIDQVLIVFLTKLLSDNYEPLVKMLRLCQVLEIYCRNSDDPLVAEIHVDSKDFRKNCEQILSDFECLGIHFHKIRFLQDPKEHGLTFDEAPAVPRIQNNPRLFRSIQSRLGLTDGYWRTVADVAKWGFECDLDPNRNSRTMFWLWRAVSTELPEK